LTGSQGSLAHGLLAHGLSLSWSIALTAFRLTADACCLAGTPLTMLNLMIFGAKIYWSDDLYFLEKIFEKIPEPGK
jgi:hypothetical protein